MVGRNTKMNMATIKKEKALDVVRQMVADGQVSQEVAEKYFTELKESEGERMVKFIKKQLFNIKKTITENYELDAKLTKAIDWVEKQGEQTIPQANERAWLYLVSDVLTWKDGIGQYLDEPRVQELAKKLCSEYAQKLYTPLVLSNSSNTGKDEPKFHEGEWVVYECGEETATLQIIGIVEETYEFSDDSTLSVADEDTLRLWDITKDAKSGDVLYTPKGLGVEGIFIVDDWKKVEDTGRTLCCSIGYRVENDEIVAGGLGAIWWKGVTDPFYPATKEQRDLLFQKMKEAGYEWDAEKKKLKEIEEEVNGEDYGIDSLYHAQRILEKTLGSVDGYQSDDGILEHKCAISAVKKLYEQKPVWNEEDRKKIIELISMFESAGEGCPLMFTYRMLKDYIRILKSCIPQKQWKPSEEQMKALEHFVRSVGESGYASPYGNDTKLIYSLLEQLKKLREE